MKKGRFLLTKLERRGARIPIFRQAMRRNAKMNHGKIIMTLNREVQLDSSEDAQSIR